jgi:flagellar protein FlbD
MVRLTRLNHREVVINAELIEFIDTSPDTVVSLTTGEKVLVEESPEEVIERVIRYKRRIFRRRGRRQPVAAGTTEGLEE